MVFYGNCGIQSLQTSCIKLYNRAIRQESVMRSVANSLKQSRRLKSTMRKLPSIVLLFFGVLSTAVGQPTISGVNAFWWLGSGVLSDGNGCSTNSSPCYYAQASWTANPNGASGTPTWYVNTVSGGGNVSLSCTTCSSTVATSTAPSNGCVYDVSVYVHYPDGSESSH